MMNKFACVRQNHRDAHVAMAAVPYVPFWGIPLEARNRHKPWQCTFHTSDGTASFTAFGGREGMLQAVLQFAGPKVNP